MLQTAINFLNELAKVMPWDAALYAPILSPILLLIKKVAGIKNGEVMLWLLAVGSGICGVILYAMQNINDPSLIALNAAVTALAAQPFYMLILRPAYKYIAAKVLESVTKAAKFNEDVKSAAIPTTPTVDITDISR